MPKVDSPLLLSPVFKPKIWGRRTLAPLFGPPSAGAAHVPPRHVGDPRGSAPGLPGNENELIGEAWLTDEASRFLNGPLAGLTLAEASRKYGAELHGKNWRDPRFPILAKYIFTSDWLSVQVHPDDDYARVHDPGNLGKCEMWYFVHADSNAEILLGLKAGVTPLELKAACGKGTSKSLLNSLRPKTGDAVLVPPGAVHALGPGLVLFEAEENSDLTYRLDDFGRLGLDGKPRPLHWDKALDVIRPAPPGSLDLPRIVVREPYGSRRYVLASRFFAVEELTLRRAASFQSSPDRVEVLSILEGNGRVETAAGWLGCRAGDTWVIPPGAGRYRLAPRVKTRLLKFYVPDFHADFAERLRRRGIRASQWKKIIFN